MRKKSRKKKDQPEFVGLLGVGLDNRDGHHRVTQGENFFLVGGSANTHEKMQDAAIHVNEKLKELGKTLEEASVEEIVDLFREKQA